MGFFKKIFRQVTQSVVATVVAPVVAVAAVGYVAHRTNQYINRKADAEMDRGYRTRNYRSADRESMSESIEYRSPVCGSAVSAEVAAIKSQADIYDKRFSMMQAGLNSFDDKTKPYYQCANSNLGEKIRMEAPTIRTTQAYCASSLADQTKYLNQSKQMHDKMYDMLHGSDECKKLADAVSSLAPLNPSNSNVCKIDPAVAEISADADRTWGGMKKLEAQIAKAQSDQNHAQALYKVCRVNAQAGFMGVRRGACVPVEPNPLLECAKVANLEGPLSKIRGLSRAIPACRSNYDHEYNDLAQMKEYEAGLRLAMAGKEVCNGLGANLANAPIPQRDVAAVAQDTQTSGSGCKGTDCSAGAVK